jgi:Tfp pilus assembly protein PilF
VKLHRTRKVISTLELSQSVPISDFGNAVRLAPDHAEAYANRGIAFLLQGKKLEAERDFSRSLTLKPDLKSVIEQRRAQIAHR